MNERTRLYNIAHAAGWDAGNKSMRDNGRTQWDYEDFQAATDAFNAVFYDPNEEGKPND